MRRRYGPTAKEIRFIDRYTTHGNGKEAAIEAGYSEKSAQSMASQLKKKLSAEIDKALRDKLGLDSSKMLAVIHKLAIEAKSEDVQLKAAKDWLDRAGYRPVAEFRDLTEKQTPDEIIAALKQSNPDLGAVLEKEYLPADQKELH